MKTIAFFMATLVPAIASAQGKPTTGYAPVNGLKMYYEVHGRGEPVVLLHGAYMTIPGNWTGWIAELSKTRKVIAVEMQGHGRTADIKRDLSFENLAGDVAALLDHLKIPSADLIGYSMGGGVAMQCAIRHPPAACKPAVRPARRTGPRSAAVSHSCLTERPCARAAQDGPEFIEASNLRNADTS